MNKINKAVLVISKIGQILMIIFMALLGALTIYSLFQSNNPDFISSLNNMTWTFENVNFDFSLAQKPYLALIFILVFAIIFIYLLQRIFKNIYLIFKTTEGTSNLSEEKTPFQMKNVKRFNDIAITVFVIALIKMIFVAVLSYLIQSKVIIKIDVITIFYGLIVLCLAQYFRYGVSLQEEVDGLL